MHKNEIFVTFFLKKLADTQIGRYIVVYIVMILLRLYFGHVLLRYIGDF